MGPLDDPGGLCIHQDCDNDGFEICDNCEEPLCIECNSALGGICEYCHDEMVADEIAAKHEEEDWEC